MRNERLHIRSLLSSIVVVLMLISNHCHSQLHDEKYIAFGASHILTFMNDSMLSIRGYHKPMFPARSFYTSYKRNGDTIKFDFKKKIINTDEVKRSGLDYLNDLTSVLVKNNSEWIDHKNEVIYVLAKKMYKKKYFRKRLLVLDGKKYIHKSPLTDGNGIVVKNGTWSKGLRKLLRNLKKDSTYYLENRLTLFESYGKYGLLGLKGVTEYITRNK